MTLAKHKIPKNRSIEDMFKGVQEEDTFETTGWEDDDASPRRQPVRKSDKKQTAGDFRRQFFTDDLQEKVGSSSSTSRWPILKTVSVISPWKS